MIRNFDDRKDLQCAKEIHQANGLPEGCFPNLYVQNERGELVSNPLFIIKAVCEAPDGTPAMMAFTKLQGELYLLLRHDAGTPEELWKWLQEFKEWMAHEAWKQGLEQLSCWVPREIEASFAKRLRDMGFEKSPYVCWTLNL